MIRCALTWCWMHPCSDAVTGKHNCIALCGWEVTIQGKSGTAIFMNVTLTVIYNMFLVCLASHLLQPCLNTTHWMWHCSMLLTIPWQVIYSGQPRECWMVRLLSLRFCSHALSFIRPGGHDDGLDVSSSILRCMWCQLVNAHFSNTKSPQVAFKWLVNTRCQDATIIWMLTIWQYVIAIILRVSVAERFHSHCVTQLGSV